jgi:hypothetical protein
MTFLIAVVIVVVVLVAAVINDAERQRVQREHDDP